MITTSRCSMTGCSELALSVSLMGRSYGPGGRQPNCSPGHFPVAANGGVGSRNVSLFEEMLADRLD